MLGIVVSVAKGLAVTASHTDRAMRSCGLLVMTISGRIRMLGLLIVALAVAVIAVVALRPATIAAGDLDGRILDPAGKRLGEIRRDPWGGYSIFDDKSRRLGYGRESPDGRAVEFFAPDGRRLFEIRRDGSGSRQSAPPSGLKGGGSSKGGR